MCKVNEKLSDNVKEFNIVEPRLEYMTVVEDMPEKERLCPVCDSPMAKVSMRGKLPVFDYCPHHHGYWFDEHELADYAANNMITLQKPSVELFNQIFS